MYRSMLTLAAMSLMAFPLMGCSHGGDADSGADSGDANVASSTPAIHVRQTMVLLDNGQPKVERNYRQMLADCQKGPGPLKPLDEDVAKKLGRTYLESWYEGARMAVKADRWDFTAREAPDTCQFVPIHKSQLTIIAAGSDITADLIAGTAMRQPSEGVVRHAATAETSDDKDLKAASPATQDRSARATTILPLAKAAYGAAVSNGGSSPTRPTHRIGWMRQLTASCCGASRPAEMDCSGRPSR
jgi:hypothetical protein